MRTMRHLCGLTSSLSLPSQCSNDLVIFKGAGANKNGLGNSSSNDYEEMR